VFQVGNPMQFSIGRYVGKEQGKKKWYVWGQPHKHCEIVGEGNTVTLVEDLISAHKLGAAGVTAIPLFGTRVFPCHIYFLLRDDRPLNIWLDADQEQNVKASIMNMEMLLSKPINYIKTKDDPKCLPLEQIKELTKG
jgi:DNA primase